MLAGFFQKKRVVRRYSEPSYVRGYASLPYEDIKMKMDVQTTEDKASADTDGIKSTQRLKVFSDEQLRVEDNYRNIHGDRIYFQGKWFECESSRLSENTGLAHWTSTFVECSVQEDPPTGGV